MQSLATQYETKAKQAFSAAFAEMPEKRSFWTSTFGLLLNGPKEGVCKHSGCLPVRALTFVHSWLHHGYRQY
jgi:hypothetical protein